MTDLKAGIADIKKKKPVPKRSIYSEGRNLSSRFQRNVKVTITVSDYNRKAGKLSL